MRYYRTERDNAVSLIAQDGRTAYNLTETEKAPDSFMDLAAAASLTDQSVDDVARPLTEEAPTVDLEEVREHLIRPVDPDEVWGAGVTYAISQESREGEGGLEEAYIGAYEGERPEVYFKATPTRTVGPGDSVGIRGDSDWDVPEPEFTMILHDGDIVGYTVGNDMCSRDIERENLLYLPQSKIYDKSCAIGPCVVTEETIGDPHDVEMTLTIERDGDVAFTESTSTSEMVRTVDELAEFFRRYNYIPESAALLTGTSIIPPDDFTLEEDDLISIEIENVGTLENTVEQL
ncbi:fumarylacetoacetate hydrolase family protein [Halarchaeum sp. P4]|uniref:fumarylacetoacetate hydrolase family protein n=1 Tax=Halarchaeum sp. P4 TaxID=3421639 RepID=UPI003EC015E1